MQMNLFRGYADCNPKDTTIEEVFQLIRQDAAIKDRTEKHRYYLSQNLNKEAQFEKQGCPCFSVATIFEGGKTQKHITGWPGIGMVDIDDTENIDLHQLAEAANQDPYTLLTYITISGKGLRILFLYDCEKRNELNHADQKMLYEYAFDYVNGYYKALLGVIPDPKCKTCSQLSGVAHDPNAFLNLQAKPFIFNFQTVRQKHQERAQTQKLLKKAVKAAQRLLAEEKIIFQEGSRNEYLMRMGYLLNAYGVPQSDAYNWAMENYQDQYDGNIYGILESCYKKTDEFGTLKIPSAAKTDSEKDNKWASVTDIEQFLESQVSLRFNVIRRQCEISWKASSGCEPFMPITDRDENTLWCRLKKKWNGSTATRHPECDSV